MSVPQPLRVFLYSNQPVYRVGKSYLAPTRNFTDFLAAVAALDPDWRIAIPCAERTAEEVRDAQLVEIALPSRQVIEMPFYRSEIEAPAVSLLAARRLALQVRRALRHGTRVIVAGPAPNSFLFWCSWLMPKTVRYACFVRGDTLRTVEEIYRGRLVYPLAVTLTRLFRRRVQQLLSVGRAQLFAYGAALLQQYPAAAQRRFVIAPLLDEAWIRIAPRPAPAAETFRVLYVGRLSREKNILALIDACARARGERSEFHLTIAGDGPMRATIAGHVHTLGLAERVHLAGLIPNGPRLMETYDSHDLLCLPSLTEATPRVVVEAAARGLPILATRVGSIDTMFPESVRFAPGFGAAELHEAIAACKRERSTHWQEAQRSIPRAAEFGIGYQARIVADHLAEDW